MSHLSPSVIVHPLSHSTWLHFQRSALAWIGHRWNCLVPVINGFIICISGCVFCFTSGQVWTFTGHPPELLEQAAYPYRRKLNWFSRCLHMCVVCVGGREGARQEWQRAKCHRRCLIVTEKLLNIEEDSSWIDLDFGFMVWNLLDSYFCFEGFCHFHN